MFTLLSILIGLQLLWELGLENSDVVAFRILSYIQGRHRDATYRNHNFETPSSRALKPEAVAWDCHREGDRSLHVWQFQLRTVVQRWIVERSEYQCQRFQNN